MFKVKLKKLKIYKISCWWCGKKFKTTLEDESNVYSYFCSKKCKEKFNKYLEEVYKENNIFNKVDKKKTKGEER